MSLPEAIDCERAAPGGDYLTTTMSTCRFCARLIPARVHLRGEEVWFHKHCPEHGPQEVRIYGDATAYRGLGEFQRRGAVPRAFATDYSGCPDACGLCPEHEQHVCLPILEITDHCDLECPICLVRNRASYHLSRAEVALILDRLIAAEGQIDVLNLSGGEPTRHPHFRAIVEECTARPEILRVTVSTNGLRLSREPDLVQFLADRQAYVSLQFDGQHDGVYQVLRGGAFLEAKRRLIEDCARRNCRMSLTATLVPGVNLDQVPALAELLFEQDHIVSLMLQPAAYTGNAAGFVRRADRITIPEVIRAVHGAGPGTVTADDFSPLPCSHPACFAQAFYLRTDGRRFLSVKRLVQVDRYLAMIENRAIPGTDADSFRHVSDAVYDLWAGPAAAAPESVLALAAMRRLLTAAHPGADYQPRRAWTAAERSLKSIFIHHFMDRDTFDLARARKCCQVYPQTDGRLMPACVRNCLHTA